MRDEVVAVGKFSRHACLHVGIFRVGLQRDFRENFSFRINFHQPWFHAPFDDHRVAIGQPDCGAEFTVDLAEFVSKHHLARACVFDGLVVMGDQNIPVGQYESIARAAFDLPDDLVFSPMIAVIEPVIKNECRIPWLLTCLPNSGAFLSAAMVVSQAELTMQINKKETLVFIMEIS